MNRFNWYNVVGKLAVVPVFFFYLYFALKSRDFFFFRYVNIHYSLGGLLPIEKNIFEKYEGLKKYYPTTIEIPKGHPCYVPTKIYKSGKFGKLVICKPVNGLRGKGVQLISSVKELKEYDSSVEGDYVIQEYVNYPYELGVFYRKNIGSYGGKIYISQKVVHNIIGDGKTTIGKLLSRKGYVLDEEDKIDMQKKGYHYNDILEKEKILVLRVVHNHAQGAICLDMTNTLSTKVNTEVFDHISKILGIEYGRYDVEVENLELFKQGVGFKILEVNGLTSEPLEIYDRKYSFFQAYKKWFGYRKYLYRLSMYNKKQGKIPLEKSFFEAVVVLFRNINKL